MSSTPSYDRSGNVRVGLALVGLALAVYVLSNPFRANFYDQFVWQADAYLHGRAEIEWPVRLDSVRNDYFRDVMPLPDRPGLGLLPYPPLPAIVLLPLVALFGLNANAAFLAALLGALNVGLAWRLATRLTADVSVALAGALFYAFGTAAWYAAAIGTTWYLAHVVASTCLFLGITAAIDARRASHQVAAGLFLGLAALARLTTIAGAPFFLFVGHGRDDTRRALTAAVGALVPLSALLAYNLISTGQLFHPAYEWTYRTEAPAREDLLHREWAAEDPRYVPQNLVIMLGWVPRIRPECGLGGILDPVCPLVAPDPIGMSLLLSSPGYLLAAGLLRKDRRQATARLGDGATGEEAARRLAAGAGLAALWIALVDLAHFSQGWVQVGYRFANDFAPFLLVLVVLGLDRIGVGRSALTLLAISIIVNAWGLAWGVALGW